MKSQGSFPVDRHSGSKADRGERAKLLHLEDELHKRVIGQEEGVRPNRCHPSFQSRESKYPTKPIGSFLFLGPTGVGKTELCQNSLAASSFR